MFLFFSKFHVFKICLGTLFIMTLCDISGRPDMEKGADMQTLSPKICENCRNFRIVEDNLLSFWNKTYNL